MVFDGFYGGDDPSPNPSPAQGRGIVVAFWGERRGQKSPSGETEGPKNVDGVINYPWGALGCSCLPMVSNSKISVSLEPMVGSRPSGP